MDTLLIGLALTGTTALLAPIVVISAGIRRQERAGSLAAEPAGCGAALARRVLALHGTPVRGSELTACAFGQAARARTAAGVRS
jgi:hypothetical protein